MKIVPELNLHTILRLTRWREYYGSVAFVTGLGTALAGEESLFLIGTIYLGNFLAVCFSFVFNEIEDSGDDMLDPRRQGGPSLPALLIGRTRGYILSAILIALSSGLYLSVGFWSFLYGFGSILLSFFYSWKPIRLKAKPILDLVSHGLQLGTLQFLAATAMEGGSASPTAVLFVGTQVFIMSALADLNNEIRDFKSDRRAGLRNTLSMLDIRPLASYVQYLWLAPLIVVLVFVANWVSLVGKILVATVAGGALVLYLSSPPDKRRELFFYVRSQQLGALWGLCLALF